MASAGHVEISVVRGPGHELGVQVPWNQTERVKMTDFKAEYRGVVVPSFVLDSMTVNSSEWVAFQRGVDSVYALDTEAQEPVSEYPKYWVSETGNAYYRLLKEPAFPDSLEVDAFYVYTWGPGFAGSFEPEYLNLEYVDKVHVRIDRKDLPKELGW